MAVNKSGADRVLDNLISRGLLINEPEEAEQLETRPTYLKDIVSPEPDVSNDTGDSGIPFVPINPQDQPQQQGRKIYTRTNQEQFASTIAPFFETEEVTETKEVPYGDRSYTVSKTKVVSKNKDINVHKTPNWADVVNAPGIRHFFKVLEVINEPIEKMGKDIYKVAGDQEQINNHKLSLAMVDEYEKWLSENNIDEQNPATLPVRQEKEAELEAKYTEMGWQQPTEIYKTAESRYDQLSTWEKGIYELPGTILTGAIATPVSQSIAMSNLPGFVRSGATNLLDWTYSFATSEAAQRGSLQLGREGGEQAGKEAAETSLKNVGREVATAGAGGAGRNIPPGGAGLPPGGGGQAALPGGVGRDSPFYRVHDMFENPPRTGEPSLAQKAQDAEKFLEEQLTDKFARGNSLSTRIRNQFKAAGQEFPDEFNFEAQASRVAGAPGSGQQAFVTARSKMVKALGNDNKLESYVNDFLYLKHQQEILNMYPDRKIPGGMTADEIDTALRDMRRVLGDDKAIKVVQGADEIRKYYDAFLDEKVVEGMVNPEVANWLKTNYPWYNRIRYLQDLGEQVTGKAGGGRVLSVANNGILRLTEEGSEAIPMRALDQAAMYGVQAEILIQRQRAANALINCLLRDGDATRIGAAPTTRALIVREGKDLATQVTQEVPIATSGDIVVNVGFTGPRGFKERTNLGKLSRMENGIPVTYQVPLWAEKMAKDFMRVDMNGFEKLASALNAVSRTAITSGNLAFFIPNTAIDALGTIIQNVGPFRLAKGYGRSLIDVFKEQPLLAEMRRAGVATSRWENYDPTKIARAVGKKGQIAIRNETEWQRFMRNPIKAIEKIGGAIEYGPKVAMWEKLSKKGTPLAEKVMQARRVNLDYARTGLAIRHANAFYLYLNAGIQGTMLPFRVLRDNKASRYYIAGLMGSMVANYAWNRQFPEYEDVPNTIKDGSYMFMLPSNEYDKNGNKVPHYICIVPNMREFSMFTAPINYALRKMDGKEPATFDMFLGTYFSRLNPLSQFTGQGGGLAPTQIGSTMQELAQNYDSYHQKPIVPPELANKAKPDQYNEYTSETAQRMGKYLNMSPLQIDYFINNVFGGLGQQIKSGADAVIQRVAPDDISPRISGLYQKLQDIRYPNVAAEDIQRKRNEFLYSLEAPDREALLDLERKPVSDVPIVGPISRRIYKEQGGQLYKTGQALAERETGISAKQTSNAAKALTQVNAERQASQEKVDAAVYNGEITMADWKENHANDGIAYSGALMAIGIIYPGAAQNDSESWTKYYDAIYTMASAMPDRRSRAELLVAAWRSIQPLETAPGIMDWDTFNQKREDFKDGMIPEDRKLLDDELKSRMTPLERAYYDESPSDQMSIYYNLPEGKARENYRVVNPKYDAQLNFTGRATTVKTIKAKEELKKMCEKYGVPFDKMPATQQKKKTSSSTTESSTYNNLNPMFEGLFK